MKTKFTTGRTYNADTYTLELTYLNDIYFYCKAYRVAGQEHNMITDSHWHTGTILNMGTDREALKLTNYNDTPMFRYTEEQVRATVDQWVMDRANNIKAQAEALAREKEQTDQVFSINSKQDEALKMHSDLFLELNKIVCSTGSFKAVLKDKKAIDLLNQMNLIDTYLNNNFSHQFIS